ncbi:FtsX-like permease family protein [Paenibacillus antri]|uniref:FtsX-like permease family protein n=1 Tax=Paenibacillus antri TaxID=2582848 RepID=A0A5R9G9V5_9BACL|nr:ABC transporter permease [Paenibacillus antri]TLS49493.1 FtsX-like permease family protein [Paenibacillus antri]
MIQMVLRKMANNRWLQLCLLAGLVVTVALVSSIPVYTDAVLQRMLVKDLELLQTDDNVYPGSLWSRVYVRDEDDPAKAVRSIAAIDAYATEAGERLPVPVVHYVRERESVQFAAVPAAEGGADPTVDRFAKLGAIEGLETNAKLVDGRWPDPAAAANGVYEAVVFGNALNKLRMVLGNEFHMVLRNQPGPVTADGKPIVVKAVGVVEQASERDLFIYGGNTARYDNVFLLPFDTYVASFGGADQPLRPLTATWYYAVDHTELTLDNVRQYMRVGADLERFMTPLFETHAVNNAAGTTIVSYFDREEQLRKLLWALNVPVLIMLGVFLFMVSNLLVNRQKTEISVLRSRGASRLQIVLSYATEGVILGAVALAVGPPLALGLTTWLGASNGFLTFVQRAALDVRLDAEVYRYASYAVGASFLMTMIPAAIAARATIVERKREQSRASKRPLWQTIGLDLILIAVSLYVYSDFERQMSRAVSLGAAGQQVAVDPLLFFVPALFMAGFGLLLLRIYPWGIRLLYWSGRKWWPPSLFSILLDIGRGGARYHYLMIFLVLTVGIGMYSASAARTMNQNLEDSIRYAIGADLRLTTRWENNAPPPTMGGAPVPQAASADEAPPIVQYIEPPFAPYESLPGVESVAKVFVKKDAFMESQTTNGAVQLYGIETDRFGRTAWFRNGLLQHHFNEYLNLIAETPSAVLVSRTLAEQRSVGVGDTLSVRWGSREPALFTVYGVVDYFPSFSPLPEKDAPVMTDGTPVAPMMIVGNLSYIQNRIALEPYEVWMKLEPDASRQEVFDAIRERGLPIMNANDTRERLLRMKNDPYQLSINGVMTLGFLISVLISFIGFLLYWILSMQGRAMQFGLFRAIGMSFRSLLGLLAVEQLLTTAAALVFGIGTGVLACRLFVPLFRLAFEPSAQVPPFRVLIEAADMIGLGALVCVMILAGFAALGWIVSRIQMHQALKLGED